MGTRAGLHRGAILEPKGGTEQLAPSEASPSRSTGGVNRKRQKETEDSRTQERQQKVEDLQIARNKPNERKVYESQQKTVKATKDNRKSQKRTADKRRQVNQRQSLQNAHAKAFKKKKR